jgi:hypothetical protein
VTTELQVRQHMKELGYTDAEIEEAIDQRADELIQRDKEEFDRFNEAAREYHSAG